MADKKINLPKILILLADDDEEDRMLTEEALEESQLPCKLQFAVDGEETLDYLYNRNKYADKKKYPQPHLILLDLNMPKKDGREVLMSIKKDPTLKHIPVVILTTSKAQEDVSRMYFEGVNSYITKPVSFQGMVDAMNALKSYWFNTVSLPDQ